MATEWTTGDSETPGQTLESVETPNPNPEIDDGSGQLDAGTYTVWDDEEQTYVVRASWGRTFVGDAVTFTIGELTVFAYGQPIGTYAGSEDLIEDTTDVSIVLGGEITAPGGELMDVTVTGAGGIQASEEGLAYPSLTSLYHLNVTFNGTAMEAFQTAGDPDEFLLNRNHHPEGGLDPEVYTNLLMSCFSSSNNEIIDTWQIDGDYALVGTGGAWYYLNDSEDENVISPTGGTGSFQILDLNPGDEVCFFINGGEGSIIDFVAQTTGAVQGPETVDLDIVAPGNPKPLRLGIVPT